MCPPSLSISESSAPDADPPLISMSPPIMPLVLLPSPETKLNLPPLPAVLALVPAKRHKFPPDPAVPDHTIMLMAPPFPPKVGPVSKSSDPDEPIDAAPV